MNKEITLTKAELEELKDEIRFREKVILKLKQLNGVPQKVWALEVLTKIYGTLILIIIASIVGVALRVWAR